MRYLIDRHKACPFAWKKDNEDETKLERILLPQTTYDNLIAKLKQNGKALGGDAFSRQMADRLEKNAQTSKDGVSAPLKYVELAYEGIENNISRKGMKYDTNFDRLVLMDLDEAKEAHEAAKAATPKPQPETSPAVLPEAVYDEDEEFRQLMLKAANVEWPDYDDLMARKRG